MRTAEKVTLYLLLGGGGRSGQHFQKLDADVHLYRGRLFNMDSTYLERSETLLCTSTWL